MLRESGIIVPQQIKVVSFDNLPFGEYTYPCLTAAAQDFKGLGRTAVDPLIRQIEGRKTENRIVPPIRLVKRESV